jgi:UDP-N-acetylmuramoyl-tripeptide--D-alanyl-D-alanine ligase
MKELGDYSQEEHQKLTDTLSPQIERIFLVGENFKECTSMNPQWKIFPTTGDLVEYLQTTPVAGYHILIKGSRGNQLEKVIPYL